MSIYELLVSGDLHRNVPEMSQLDTFDSDLQTSCEAAQWAGLDADARPGWKGCWTRAMTPGCGVSATGSCVLKARWDHLGNKRTYMELYGHMMTYANLHKLSISFSDRFMSFHLVSWLRVLQKHHRACDILSLGDALSGNGLWPKTRWNLLRLPFQHRQGEHQSIQKNWRLARRWQRHGRLFRSVLWVTWC